MKEELLKRIESADLEVCVLGVGYVGLPLLLSLIGAGFRAIGYDVDQSRVDTLLSGKTGLTHLPDSKLREAITTNRLRFSTNFKDCHDSSVFVICVPTPLDGEGLPDNSFIYQAMERVYEAIKPGSLVCLESTTYPGTTRETIVHMFSAKGLKLGEEAFGCFSPEREDPGSKSHDLSTTPKVVGGLTPQCGEVAAAFYQKIVQTVVSVETAEAAEMAKLIENTFRAVNIAMANEIKKACDVLKIDFYDAMDAAATKPFGFMPFYPGPGVGGHCIPVDPFYLTWKVAQEKGETPLIDKALEINETAHLRIINALTQQLIGRGIHVFDHPKILLIGAAYKPGISDVRESPFFSIAGAFDTLGIQFDYHDPLVPEIMVHGRLMKSVEISSNYAAAVIVTNQKGVDYQALLSLPFIIDSRGSYKEKYAHVIRA